MKASYKRYIKISLSSFIFTALFFGVFALMPAAAEVTSQYQDNPQENPDFQLVPDCSGSGSQGPTPSGENTVTDECGWLDLLQLFRNVMAFMLYISATIAVMSFAYAGFLYLTAFGEMGKVEQAHGIFSKVTIGFLFVFLGWLIVATVLKTMGVQNAFSLIDFGAVDVIDIDYRNR